MNEVATKNEAADETDDAPEKFLTFRLHDEEYGVDILKVREIIAFQDVTPLPRMPAHVMGVINLRGQIIPIVDLSMKLGMSGLERTNETCIVVIDVETENEDIAQFGCVVHSVRDVLDIRPSQVEPLPKLSSTIDTKFIRGLGKIGDDEKVVGLLDIDLVISTEDVELVDGVNEDDAQHRHAPAEA